MQELSRQTGRGDLPRPRIGAALPLPLQDEFSFIHLLCRKRWAH